jgi:hypothetical protein
VSEKTRPVPKFGSISQYVGELADVPRRRKYGSSD